METEQKQIYLVAGKALLVRVTPDNIIARLQQIAANHSRDKWYIGFVCNDLKRRIDEKLLPIGKMEVYDQVSEWLEGMYAPRTVRYLADIEAFFSDKCREDYNELYFSHFELAKMYGDRWKDVLDLSLKLMHENDGKKPSTSYVDSIMSKKLYDYVSNKVQDEMPSPPDNYYPDEDEAAQVQQESGDNVAVQWAGMGILSQFLKIGTLVARNINYIPISDDKRTKLNSLTGELIFLIEDIHKEMGHSSAGDKIEF